MTDYSTSAGRNNVSLSNFTKIKRRTAHFRAKIRGVQYRTTKIKLFQKGTPVNLTYKNKENCVFKQKFLLNIQRMLVVINLKAYFFSIMSINIAEFMLNVPIC